MKLSRRDLSATVAASALAGTAGCVGFLEEEASDPAIAATDWPSFQRTARNHGDTEASGPGDEPTERWTVDLPGGIGDQVAVVDGTVFACTGAGTVHAVDAASGDEDWSKTAAGARRQCPCAVGDLLVFGTESGDLVAVDRETGDEEWRVELTGPVAGPTAHGGHVYVGTEASPTVYAVDAAEGTIEWETAVDAPVVEYPAATDDAVYVGTENTAMLEGWIHRLDADTGDVDWTKEGTRMQSPAVAGGNVYAPSLDMAVYRPSGFRSGVRAVYGHILWTPAFTETASVIIGTGGILVAKPLDTDNDAPDWYLELEGRPHSGPVVADDRIYLVGDDAELVGCDYEAGTELWRRPLDGEFGNRPAVADDALFVGTSAGTLYAFE